MSTRAAKTVNFIPSCMQDRCSRRDYPLRQGKIVLKDNRFYFCDLVDATASSPGLVAEIHE